MALSKPARYALANAALVAVAYSVYRYYNAAMAQPRDGSQSRRIILFGIFLYVVIAGVVTARAYLRQGRNQVVEQSQSGSEVGALGMLGADRLKNITIKLVVSDVEFDTLQSKGMLALSPERFNVPVRGKDAVWVTTNKDVYNRSAATTVTQIDGVNRRITVTLTNRP